MCMHFSWSDKLKWTLELCTGSEWESFRWIVFFIYKSWFLFRHISKKRPFFVVWSVLSYCIEFWSLVDFEPGECLLKLCEFPLTYELQGAFEPFKGIIFWSHSHLRTYRFSVHYISLRKLPSWLWKMVLPLVLKPERQHLTEWSTLYRTPG